MRKEYENECFRVENATLVIIELVLFVQKENDLMRRMERERV